MSSARHPLYMPVSVKCLLCGYDLTGATIGGNCPECGEAVMRSFEWPHEDGIALRVRCVRCGQALKEERVDGTCSGCDYPVIRTLHGPRPSRDSQAVFAPLAFFSGLLAFPFTLFLWPVAAFFGAAAVAFLVPSIVEFVRGRSTWGSLIAAIIGGIVGMFWLVAALFMLIL